MPCRRSRTRRERTGTRGAAASARSTRLRLALIDPSLFTLAYDLKLADALERLGHDVLLYGKALEGGTSQPIDRIRTLFYRELVWLGTERWPSSLARIAKGTMHVRGMHRLIEDLRERSPDVIHFQWIPLPLIDRLFLGRLRRIAPLVLTAHDPRPFNDAASPIQKIGATAILSCFDRVIVHTKDARARLSGGGISPHRLVQIPHGILHDEAPSEARLGSATNKVRFLLFGKLKAYKGADLLIEAFQCLPAHIRALCELHIVGKPYMDVAPLRKAAQGFEHQIWFDFRFVSDTEMKAMLEQADVTVFPYREIDVSGVLMAALHHRRPIIASRIGGFAELLTDGRHGLLIPPGDLDALTAAMRRMCEEPEMRRQMAEAIPGLLKSIPSWDEIARRTANLYCELRDDGNPSRP
jgi:glycosyltransferase involved in cell wall biosynthesis